MKKLLALMLILVMALTCLAGCTKTEEPAAADDAAQPTADAPAEPVSTKPEEVRIALVGPMTGDNAQYGLQFERGLTEVVDEYNAKGGTQVKVDVYDDKNDAKEAASIANLIVADGGYAAVIGPFSSTCAFAMAEVLDEEDIITISPSCSHEDYVKLYDYTFRLSHVNIYEGKVAAEYIQDVFEGQKVAGVYTNNDWGIALDTAYVENCERLGLEVVANESFIIGETKDFSAILTKIKAAGADSIYYMGQYTECGAILKQIKDMGLDMNVIITTSSFKVESLQLAGDAAEGVVFMTAFFNDGTNERVNTFAQSMKDKYDVDIDNFSLRAYDAGDWLLAAFDECESTDPATLKDALISVGSKGFDGLGGAWVLNEERNVEREFIFTEWNGKYDADAQFQLIKK